MKKIVGLFLSLTLMFSMAACGGDGEENTKSPVSQGNEESVDKTTESDAGDPYYIAVAVPLTGDTAQYGNYIYHGVMTKVNEVNDNGGINGRKIVVETFDDKGDSNEAASIAQKICDDDKYLCVFASFASGTTLGGASIYKQNQMVQIAPTASHVDISTPGDTTWAMNPSVMVEHKLVGEIAAKDLEGKRVALVHLNADNGLLIKEAVTEGVTENGGEMVAIESYISGQVRDFGSIITKIKDSDPDVVVLTMQYADTSAFLIQSQQYGLYDEVKWLLNTDSFMDSFLEAAGAAAEGVYVEASWSKLGLDEGIVNFRQVYNGMWEGEDPTSYSAQPYEAMCMVVEAMKNGASTTSELQDYLTNLGEWDGETFSGHFGEDQRFIREKVALSVVEDGEFVPIY